jgi:hypothetical protein
MREIVIWLLLVVALATAADQALLKMESRGWIHYRRHGISRGAAAYHIRELQSIYDPGIQHVIEIQTKEQARRDDTGDPLV